MKYLQIQQKILALKAGIACNQRTIASSEASNTEARQCTKSASKDPELTGDTSEATPPVSPNTASTTLPIQTHHTPVRNNHQDKSESENKYSNKPPTKKAVLETYWGKSHHKLQIFKANLKNHFEIHQGYIQDKDCCKITEALQCINRDLMLHWQQHQEELDWTPTYNNFIQFLYHQVADPQTYKEQAAVKFYITQQKPTQSTHDYATYLRG